MTMRTSFLPGTLAAVALALAALTGCGGSDASKVDAAKDVVAVATGAHAITPADNGKAISAAVGDTITFTAEENGSTGYVWAATFDAAVLEEGESSYAAKNTDPNIVGAPGVRTMTFKVKAAGKTTLSLKNARSWESSSPAQQVDVVVEAK